MPLEKIDTLLLVGELHRANPSTDSCPCQAASTTKSSILGHLPIKRITFQRNCHFAITYAFELNNCGTKLQKGIFEGFYFPDVNRKRLSAQCMTVI